MFSTEEFAEALFDNEVFDSVLRRVARAAGARSFLTGWYDTSGVHQMTWDSGWWPAHQIELYSRDWAYRDVWSEALLADWRPNIARNLASLVRDQSVENSELYNEFFRPMGDNTFYSLAVAVGSDAGTGALAMHRGRDQSAFTQQDFEVVQAIEKPLARLVEMRGRFSTLQRDNVSLGDGIDRLGHAIFFLAPNLRLRHANAKAERLLASGTPFRIDTGILQGVGVEVERALENGIRQLEDPLNAGWISFVIAGPSRIPRTMMLTRIPRGPSGYEIMLAVRDPDREDQERRLSRLYGLTAAEADIAIGLAEGLGIPEIAANRGTSVGTVRLQLARIAEKLGCTKQSQIVAVVSAVTSAI